jgi:hypothetical protein
MNNLTGNINKTGIIAMLIGAFLYRFIDLTYFFQKIIGTDNYDFYNDISWILVFFDNVIGAAGLFLIFFGLAKCIKN